MEAGRTVGACAMRPCVWGGGGCVTSLRQSLRHASFWHSFCGNYTYSCSPKYLGGPVAQWIRHRPTEPGIADSSPAGVMVSCADLSWWWLGRIETHPEPPPPRPSRTTHTHRQTKTPTETHNHTRHTRADTPSHESMACLERIPISAPLA